MMITQNTISWFLVIAFWLSAISGILETYSATIAELG